MDRHCLPKNKVRLLSSEDIALRRQQVREKLAQFTMKQEQGDNVAVQEQQVKSEDVLEDGPIFIAFARVFSGTLKRGRSCTCWDRNMIPVQQLIILLNPAVP